MISAWLTRRGTRTRHTTAILAVAAGLTMLLLRPTFAASARPPALLILGTLYTAILMASLAVPMPSTRPKPLNRALVLIAGLAALGLGTIAAGTPVPVPWGVWALPFSLLAAVAEEALFRRVAYGGLERCGPAVAVVGSALLFALVHVPALRDGGAAAWTSAPAPALGGSGGLGHVDRPGGDARARQILAAL